MQQSATRFAISLSWCKARKRYLAFCFAFGCILGILTACATTPNCLLLMRRILAVPVSIVGGMAVWLLPFLITAFAVYKLPAWCILPIAFCKAFSYGFVLQLIYTAFPGAGWLIRSVFLITDSVSVLLLYRLWLRYIEGKMPFVLRDFAICFCILSALTVLDHCLLSPFLVMLINN